MNAVNVTLDQGSHRKPESSWKPRCSAIQREAIERALTGRVFDTDQLGCYVATGDMAYLDATTTTDLQAVVKQAKAGLTASQAKRIWPRKVASVYLNA